MSAANQKPWDQIPNPFNFPPLEQQVKQIQRLQKVASGVQRKTPFGKDWLGQSFTRGDLVLGTGGSDNSFFEVEDVILDDGKGNPYTEYSYHLYLEQSTQSVYQVTMDYDPFQRIRREFIQLVDPEWIGTHIGLLIVYSPYHSNYKKLPQDFEPLTLQSFKVRAKPLTGDSKRRSLTPSQITVMGKAPLTRELTEHYLAARETPLLGDPIEL
jgi:hypothetical protein